MCFLTDLKALFAALLLALACLPGEAAETRLLRYPDIHEDKIVFCYGGDIYTASSNGQNVKRLTSFPGEELLPKFSPDGERIAFSAEFEGNKEVYVMSVQGGKPKRLTFHPAEEYVVDWHPDGAHIIFRSNGSSFSYRFNRLHRVAAQGGLPTVLELAEADLASFNDRGDRIAFCRTSLETLFWKRYRGGAGPNIWTYDFKTRQAELVIDDRSINHHPLWLGDVIYFVSDRGKTREQNLWAYSCTSRAVRQLTFYEGWSVRWPSQGGGRIIYENEGRLCVYDAKSGKIASLKISLAHPDGFLAATIRNVKGGLSSATLSPDGQSVIVGARGELFRLELPTKTARNLTGTPGINERSAVWSPDGRRCAYISDASGEEEIYIRTDGSDAAPIQVSHGLTSKLGGLNWSPDGTKIGYSDKRASFYVVELETGEVRKIFFNEYFASERFVTAAWSPDSRWLAYENGSPNWFSSVFLYSFESGRSFRVTDELTNAYQPRFDPQGRYLFWIADDSVNVQDSYWDDDHHMVNPAHIIAATLRQDQPSPFPAVRETGSPRQEQAAFPIRIDLEGLGHRTAALPVGSSNYRGLIALRDKLIYQSSPDNGDSAVKVYDLLEQKEAVLLQGTYSFSPGARGGKLVYYAGGRAGLLDISPDGKGGDVPLDLSGLTMTIDHRKEWPQIFNEAWRIQRDFFFSEGLRGVDWEAMKRKYEVFLPFVASRRDLNDLIAALFSELGQSHVEIQGGETPRLPANKIGLLGIDLEWDPSARLYRIAKIYRGRNTEPGMESPLTLPGLNIKEGDYLLAIDGAPLQEGTNPDAHLVDKAGENVVLTIHDKPTRTGARTVGVRAASFSESQGDRLRYNDWVLCNIEKVSRASGGKVGYIHIPDTSSSGMEAFFRYFYAQIHKEGLVIDIRFNSGGYSPYWMIERLNRSMIYYSRFPYGKAPMKEPSTGFFGPKACLVNEWAESGGENFASIFRLIKAGPLIGRRTAGNLASTRGFSLLDGGVVMYPAEGKQNGRGEDVVENIGVLPDLETVNRPDDLVRGKDPQLERGILEIMKRLAEAAKDR